MLKGIVDLITTTDKINSFISVLLVAMALTLFEILFFNIIGAPDIKKSLTNVSKNIMRSLDTKVYSNYDYCAYLADALLSGEHAYTSIDLFYKHCLSRYLKNDDNQAESIYHRIDDSEYNYDGKYFYKYNRPRQIGVGYELKNVLMPSLYHYYRKHPEFIQGVYYLSDKIIEEYNNELLYNALELLVLITILSFITISVYNRTHKENNLISKRNIISSCIITISCIMVFQVYFYRNVSVKYKYEGMDTNVTLHEYLNRKIEYDDTMATRDKYDSTWLSEDSLKGYKEVQKEINKIPISSIINVKSKTNTPGNYRSDTNSAGITDSTTIVNRNVKSTIKSVDSSLGNAATTIFHKPAAKSAVRSVT